MSDYPEDLRYTKDHEWIRLEDGGRAVVGITEFAQAELGEIVFADLPKIGRLVKKGESLCVVESTKAASDVYAPVTGAVIEANTLLKEEPSKINLAPYREGWLVRIEVSDLAEIEALLSPAQYRSHVTVVM